MMAQQRKCKECGWSCHSCDDQGVLQLHVEVENLKQQLLERESHIRSMETSFLAEAEKFPNGQAAALTEELLTWQDKYSRLYESYKRVQKVNQSLEDKLLKIVDKCETEKNDLLKEVTSLTQRLSDARTKVNRLQSENERYKNDVNLAIQLLQCKPANFVPQKYDTLPTDLQQKVLAYVCGRRRPSDVGAVPIRVEMRTIKVPVSTSPPTAMLYPVEETHSPKDSCGDESNEDDLELINETEINHAEGRPPLDNVSAAIMAKVLQEREKERQQGRHCGSCTCFTHVAPVTVDSSTQTAAAELDTNISSLNGYTATTRGSQGHVRFVDSLSRKFNGNTSTNFPTRLGLKLAENKSVKYDTPLFNIDSSEVKISDKVEHCLIDLNSDCTSKMSELHDFSELERKQLSGNLSHDERLGRSIEPSIVTDVACHHNNKSTIESVFKLGSQSDNQNSVIGDCLIDFEVPFNGNCDVLKSNRIKELSVAGNIGDAQKNISIGCSQPSIIPQNSHSKTLMCEPQSVLSTESGITAKSPSNWVRYPSDGSKKNTLVISNDKTVVPSVRSSDACASRVQFPSLSLRGSNRSENSPGSGPRFCSMRLQAGTSNILLDNATSYEPVLYTSRHTQDGVESWGVSASRSGAAVLVHAPRSRAPSLDETPPQNKVALWVHANQSQTDT